MRLPPIVAVPRPSAVTCNAVRPTRRFSQFAIAWSSAAMPQVGERSPHASQLACLPGRWPCSRRACSPAACFRLAAMRGLRADLAALGLGALAAAALPPIHAIPVLARRGSRSARTDRRRAHTGDGGTSRLVVRLRAPCARALLGYRGDPVRGGAVLVAGAIGRSGSGGGAGRLHCRCLRRWRAWHRLAGRASWHWAARGCSPTWPGSSC